MNTVTWTVGVVVQAISLFTLLFGGIWFLRVVSQSAMEVIRLLRDVLQTIEAEKDKHIEVLGHLTHSDEIFRAHGLAIDIINKRFEQDLMNIRTSGIDNLTQRVQSNDERLRRLEDRVYRSGGT